MDVPTEHAVRVIRADGRNAEHHQQVAILLGVSVMLSLGMGMRQSLGRFVMPVNRELPLRLPLRRRVTSGTPVILQRVP